MLRRLSEYQLGIFMPHMHDEHTGEFQPLPDEVTQVESGLEVSFQPTAEIAQPDQIAFSPWDGCGVPVLSTPVAACEMISGRSERFRAPGQTQDVGLHLFGQGDTMKTSVIDVHAMLSVLSVDDVEQRIGEVPGVESVTVNYAAGSATVRYDETRLEVADIKSAVRQRGYESAAPAAASAGDGHEGHTARGAPPARPRRRCAEDSPGRTGPPLPPRRHPLPPQPPRPRLPPAKATRATRRRARSPPCRRTWRMRWAMAARTCRPWSATCATVSGSA